MMVYTRGIRKLDELSQFKANEHFNWLFYVAPVVFRNRTNENLFKQLLNFMSGIRLLLESSMNEKIQSADKLLSEFCENVVEFFEGEERMETINLHSLKHLSAQVQRFGPLFTSSAMSFEAANRTLGEVFTGSVNECEIVCRRVLQKYKIATIELENESFRPFYDVLSSGLHKDNEENFDKEMEETTSIKDARSLSPESQFFNR